MDIAIKRNNDQFDITLDGPELQADNGLHTAVLISLFTDRQAEPDDELPDGTTNRRGWWANPKLGSRLWLLTRASATDDVLERAREYVEEALQWLVDDGVAKSIVVTTEWQGNRLAMLIEITQADDSRFEEVFTYSLEAN